MPETLPRAKWRPIVEECLASELPVSRWSTLRLSFTSDAGRPRAQADGVRRGMPAKAEGRERESDSQPSVRHRVS